VVSEIFALGRTTWREEFEKPPLRSPFLTTRIAAMMDPVILLEALIYVITIVGFIREDKPRPVKSESSPSSESDSRQRAAEKETLLERIQTLEGYVQGLTNQQYDLNEKLSDREYKLEIREAELELLRMDVIEMAKQLDWMLLDTDKEKSNLRWERDILLQRMEELGVILESGEECQPSPEHRHDG